MFHDLPPIKDQLKKCVRCGQCRSVCPVFREIGTENTAPRGHVFMAGMLRDREISPSSSLAAKMNQCLLCEACTNDCPSGIPVHEIVAASRDYLARYQLPIKNMLLKSIWTRPSRLKWFHRLTRYYQSTGLQNIAHKTGLVKAIAGKLAPAEGLLGSVPAQTAMNRLSAQLHAQTPRKYKVGYFLGCATNLFNTDTAVALVEVLNRHDYKVIIPKGLNCCGLPQYANSGMTQAKKMARANIEAFASLGLDYIVTDCASCSSTIKSSLYSDWEDPQFQKQARNFQTKVYDINAFLVQIVDFIPPMGELEPFTVTYHDPCHLAHSQKITAAPREILRRIPGIEFKEMAVQDQCCGGGGTFSFFNYDLSMKILDRKISLIKDTNAEIITTSCPACTMQLKHGLAKAGIQGRIIHPVELLYQSYSKQSSE